LAGKLLLIHGEMDDQVHPDLRLAQNGLAWLDGINDGR
jgi:dipeptidyl aminopeptidase/acylaminoacyl peptidase